MARQLSRMRKTGVGDGADEEAPLVNRQLAHVLSETVERSALEEILLNIRSVKGGHRKTVLAQIVSHCCQGLLSAEISHDRNYQILPLQVAHEFIVLFGCKEVAEFAILIRLGDEVLHAGKETAAHAIHPIGDLQPVAPKVFVNIVQAGLIRFRKLYLEV